MSMPAPGDKVGHAELKIGNSIFMLADEFPGMNALSPKSIGGTPVSLMAYVENVDQKVEIALAAGATIKNPLKDQFCGAP